MFTCPATDDFFRSRIDQMIDLRHPLAVLASRMPWQEIEARVAHLFVRKAHSGEAMPDLDLFGEKPQRVATRSNAGGNFDTLAKHKYRRNATMAVKLATEAHAPTVPTTDIQGKGRFGSAGCVDISVRRLRACHPGVFSAGRCVRSRPRSCPRRGHRRQRCQRGVR